MPRVIFSTEFVDFQHIISIDDVPFVILATKYFMEYLRYLKNIRICFHQCFYKYIKKLVACSNELS